MRAQITACFADDNVISAKDDASVPEVRRSDLGQPLATVARRLTIVLARNTMNFILTETDERIHRPRHDTVLSVKE